MKEKNPSDGSEHGLTNPLRNHASKAVPICASFMAVVALLLNSPSLFYMATALIALLIACHVQAKLSVRGLNFERIAPESAAIGELVTVEITVWSERRIRRPLITIRDHLPKRMQISVRTASLPVAPAYDIPVQSLYQFRPLRRGLYRWTSLTVEGTDPLGLIVKGRDYATEPTEMLVLPRPIPVAVDLPAAAGFGISENETGNTRGAGLEPFGVREYVAGDSLRHVHWRSTAKQGKLLVKEFEAGTHSAASFIIQRTKGTDLGRGKTTSLDFMCGHILFLAEALLRQGMKVFLPGIESVASNDLSSERLAAIARELAVIEDDSPDSIGNEVRALLPKLATGSVLFVLVVAQDPDLTGALRAARNSSIRVVPLLYDAKAFRSRTESAADASFIESLRLSGGIPVVMPVDLGRAGEERIHA